MKTRLCLAALALLLLASPVQAGWVVQQETPGGPSTMYLQSNQVRAGAHGGGVIYDLNAGMVTMINPNRQVYWSGQPQELNRQMNQNLDARMEEALQRVPPEQREQMRAMMQRQRGGGQGQRGGGMAPPEAKVEVKATGESAKIAGYASKKYQVYVDGKLRQELWIAELPGFRKEMDLNKMMKLAHAMRAGGPGPGLGWRRAEPVQQLMVKGMPMKIVEHGPDGPMTVLTVTKLEKKSLPASTFQPPAGYKKVAFDQMMR